MIPHYLIINIACITIPFVCSFYRKHAFYREWKYLLPANLVVAILFLVWDFWFTKIGVWGFNPKYLTGIYIANLPIEEILFFFCIPYACVFTYFAFQFLIPRKYYNHYNRIPSILLLLILMIFAILYADRIYTFFTSIFLCVVILYTVLKKINLNLIFLSYFAILPFFFLSNGVLTGSFIEEPIVWYNNSETLNLRIFSVPVEDVFYGFLLILCVILLYEKIKFFFEEKRKI